MLLIAVVPYRVWGRYGGTFPAWQAHRAAFLAALVVAVTWMVLRLLGCSPARARVIVALPVLAVLFVHLSPVVLFVVLAAALLAAVLDRGRAYENAALVLTVMGAVLLAGSVSPLVRHMAAERQVVGSEREDTRLPPPGTLTLARTPSIIHIVLDGYGAPGPLAEIYGHDAGPFLDALERRGFVIVEDAVTPYSQTLPAMASVMSGAPVDMSDDRGHPTRLRIALGHTIRHGPVPAVFEAAGYTFARGRSGYGFVDFGDALDVTRQAPGLTPLEASMFRGLGAFFGPVHNDMLKAALAPGTLSGLPQPFFYYQHLIAPHPPFSIAADGSARASRAIDYADGNHFIADRPERRARYLEGYREKARFVETALLAQIDAFPRGPKIVIVHGDHGPGAQLHHESAALTCMRERLNTFVAVYSDVPGLTDRFRSRPGGPFPTVNIYRAILSSLTGSEIPFLAPSARHLRWSDPTEATPASPADLARPCGAVLNAGAAAGMATVMSPAPGDATGRAMSPVAAFRRW